MTASPGTPHTLKDIRARSAVAGQTVVPYKAYMALTALEMEKLRRQTERRTLIARLKSVQARLRVIEAERANLLQHLSLSAAGPSGMRRVSNLNPIRPRSNGGFKLQY